MNPLLYLTEYHVSRWPLGSMWTSGGQMFPHVTLQVFSGELGLRFNISGLFVSHNHNK